MIINGEGARATAETIDYSDEDSRPLLLTRVAAEEKPSPVILHRRLVEVKRASSERKGWTRDIPRLSMLIRFEREHEKRLSRVRPRMLVTVMLAFALGLGTGVVSCTPGIGARAANMLQRSVGWMAGID